MSALTRVVDPSPRRSRSAPTTIARTLIGLLSGLIVGAAATVVAVGWAITTAVESRRAVSILHLIEVRTVDGSVHANSGDGVLIPTLVACTVGAAMGACAPRVLARTRHMLVRSRRRSTRS